MSTVEMLRDAISMSNNIVFVGGAGVSTASGLPDFRGTNGLYTVSSAEKPEDLLGKKCFKENPSKWFKFYREHMVFDNAEPNIIHKKLAELEAQGKLLGIITQNIDGLHQKAGSKNVIEIHGTSSVNYCTKCNREYEEDYIKTHCDKDYVSRCEKCGGVVRPDMTLFGEAIDTFKLYDATALIEKADMLIAAGTSLKVYPVTGLVSHFKGKTLAILNNQPTPEDKRASIVLRDNLVDIFSQL